MSHVIAPRFIGPSMGAIAIPAGVVIGYEGTVASIPVGWALCDGTGGTPDLVARYIRGANGSSINRGDTGGANAGQVTGTSSSDGAHGGIGGRSGDGGAGGGGGRGTGGAHSHTLTGDMDWQPPSRELLYIKSMTEAPLPEDAIVWRFDVTVPSGYSELTAMRNRFAFGVSNNSRAQIGSDSRSVNFIVASGGGHTHQQLNIGAPGGGGNNHSFPSGEGAHTHSNFSDTVAAAKPSYLALLCVVAGGENKGFGKLVLAYDGDDLPDGWFRCDGTSGTPDLRTRLIVGSGGTYTLGDTGGEGTTQPVSGSSSVPSASVTHSHTYLGNTEAGSAGDHSSYTWTHSHASWSGNYDPMPPWHALYFIMKAA